MAATSLIKPLGARIHGLFPCRKKKMRSNIQSISAPFDFRKETTLLPGFTHDELHLLRDQAAASRVGDADDRIRKTAASSSLTPYSPLRTSSVGKATLGMSPVSPLDVAFPKDGLPIRPIAVAPGGDGREKAFGMIL